VIVLPEEPSYEVARVPQTANEEIQVCCACASATVHYFQHHFPERHPPRARVSFSGARAEGQASARHPERMDFGLHPLSRYVDAHEICIRASTPYSLGIGFHKKEHSRWARLERHMKKDMDSRLHHVEMLPVHIYKMRVASRAHHSRCWRRQER